jgi:SAM-dependent methyltransferase
LPAQCIERTRPHGATASNDRDAVADVFDLTHVMAAQQHGDAIGDELAKKLTDVADPMRIETGRGLVEQQQLRLTQERGRDAETLPHASGEPGNAIVATVAEPDATQDLVDVCVPRRTVESNEQLEVVRRRQVGVERRLLHEAGNPVQGSTLRPLSLPQQLDVAGIRPQQPEEQTQQRGLASAVRAEQPVKLAILDNEVETVERARRAEVFDHSRRTDRRHCASLGTPAPGQAPCAGPAMIGDVTPRDEYLLDNKQVQAGIRFDAFATIFDPWTFQHVEQLGVQPGWRCWEVGAGSQSVPRWLAEKVRPGGHVIATDIDVSLLRGQATAFEVRRHDVGVDDPPMRSFDLVHARLVLVHVAQRAAALRSMVAALRPGGWLLIEDADPALQPLACPDEYGAAQQLANKVRQGFRALLAARQADLAYGRKLPRLLREAGLVDVQADAFFPVASPAGARLEVATVEQLRDQLVAAGGITADEVDEHLSNVSSGQVDVVTAPLISAWGRCS